MKLLILFCTLISITGCSSLKGHPDTRNLVETRRPEDLVNVLFVERSQKRDYEFGSMWNLDELQGVFDGELGDAVDEYVNAYKKNRRNARRPDGAGYYMLSFDPVTSCPNSHLLAVKMSRLEKTPHSEVYRVRYRLFGSTAPYTRDVRVTLSKTDSGWKITNVDYHGPDFPLLGEDQSMTGMLQFLSARLRKQ